LHSTCAAPERINDGASKKFDRGGVFLIRTIHAACAADAVKRFAQQTCDEYRTIRWSDSARRDNNVSLSQLPAFTGVGLPLSSIAT
jgi:hypothetical protein